MSYHIFTCASEGMGIKKYQGSQEPRFCPFCCQKQGELKLPVFLVESGANFQCPNCSRRFNSTGTIIKKELPAGQVGW